MAGSRSRRVLFLASQPFLQWRGTPLRVGFDVRALAEAGYAVDLVTLPLGEAAAIPGVRIIRVPNLFRVREVAIGPSLAKAAFDAVLLVYGLCLALRHRYGFVHGVEDTGIVGLAIARLTGARAVFEKHSDVTAYRQGALLRAVMRGYGCVERFTLRHADAVIATGPGLAREARALRGERPTHHIFDIPSSPAEASPERTAERRARLQRTPDDVVITYVGSFAVYQGVDLLFDAIPRVAAACPAARFVIIGGTPAEVAERRARLRAQGCEDAVLFAGKVPPDALPDYLSASDILVSPRASGMNTPLKILDYFKAGRAIVATDMASHRLILDETTALLVPPEPAAFAAGLAALADDPERRRRLGAAGRALARERYNFAAFRERLEACYAQARDREPA
ncbi:MAG: glycosyltransferase [Lentisphaerae bacterium]|nr:glycosyltransferase [Lentisphaerota bacterium]